MKQDIAKQLGVSDQKIKHRTDIGLIIPGVFPKSGRGKTGRYSKRNFIEAGMRKVVQDRYPIHSQIVTVLPDTLREATSRK